MKTATLPPALGVAHASQNDPLHIAAAHDSAALVKKLLAAGHAISACDGHGNTALHVAAACGAISALQVLLQETTRGTAAPGRECSATDGSSSSVEQQFTLEWSSKGRGCETWDQPKPGVNARNAGLDARNAGLDARNAGVDARNAGMDARNAGVGARNAGVGARNAGVGARNAGVGARDAGVGARDAGVGARNAGMGARNAGVDAPNAGGWTALMQAARYARPAALELLLEFGADVSKVNCLEMDALALASAAGDVTCVRTLIRGGATPTPAQMSAVVAALYGHQGALQLLLDVGASASTPTLDTGITPLMAAALSPSMSCVELLLSRGADPNLLSAVNNSALQFARHTEDAHQLEALLQPLTAVNHVLTDAPMTAMMAVCAGDLLALHSMLAQDPQQAVNANSDGVTALMAAAVLGQEGAALLLLQHGADPNAVEGINGWTPLMLALYNGHLGVAQLLLRRGADISRLSPQDHTIFDFATQTPCLDIMRAYIRTQCTEDVTLPVSFAPDGDRLPSTHNHGIKKWFTKVSDRLQRARSEKDLGKVPWCQSAASWQDVILPPVPPIVGKPILPNLPHRPPEQRMPPGAHYEQDDFLSRSVCLQSPLHTDLPACLEWATSLFGETEVREMRLGAPPPRWGATPSLVSRINRQRTSGSESSAVGSSDTASTGTTVQTRRDGSRQHERNMSPVEVLTMSLGERKVSEVLRKLSLDDHNQQFEEEDVDFDAFLELTPDDIKELGVKDQQSRQKILSAIQSLRKKV